MNEHNKHMLNWHSYFGWAGQKYKHVFIEMVVLNIKCSAHKTIFGISPKICEGQKRADVLLDTADKPLATWHA